MTQTRSQATDRAALALAVLLTALSARAEGAAEDEGAPAIEETVEVPGRLGTGGPQAKKGRAVSVEQVAGEQLRASGARSLAEYLARLPGVTAVDETGNGRQLSIDLRGFAATPGATALVVNGLRLNDPDTGAAPYSLVQAIDVERVELRKGPLGPLLGGGSLAGGLQVVLRPASRRRAQELRLGLGERGLRELAVFATGPAPGGLALAGSLSLQEAGTPRRRASVAERSARLQVRRALGDWELALELSALDGEWDQPGALTAGELEADRQQSIWNRLDDSKLEHRLSSLTIEREGRGATDLRAVLAHVEQRTETLSTGRSGFGFLTRQRTRSWRFALEGLSAPAAWRRGEARLKLRWGLEATRDELAPEGWTTTAIHEGGYDEAFLSSDVDVSWRGLAGWLGAVLQLRDRWTAEIGWRQDRSAVARAGFELDRPASEAPQRRRFEDGSLGFGLARRFVGDRRTGELRASWSQSFLAPSSTQLFAFPGYFANPDLRAQGGSGWILGGGLAGKSYSLDLELFRTRVDDEIVFDAEARKNRNAGRTSRSGAEMRLSLRPHARVELLLGQVFTDAEFERSWTSTEGEVPAGSRVPLVPASRTSLRVEWRPAAGWSTALTWLRTSSLVADNDFDNSSERVPAQELVHLELGRELRRRSSEWSLRLSVENLLNHPVVTRGIELGGELYFTPAAPRTLSVSLVHHHRPRSPEDHRP